MAKGKAAKGPVPKKVKKAARTKGRTTKHRRTAAPTAPAHGKGVAVSPGKGDVVKGRRCEPAQAVEPTDGDNEGNTQSPDHALSIPVVDAEEASYVSHHTAPEEGDGKEGADDADEDGEAEGGGDVSPAVAEHGSKERIDAAAPPLVQGATRSKPAGTCAAAQVGRLLAAFGGGEAPIDPTNIDPTKWLTKDVLKTARDCCREKISRRNMYPTTKDLTDAAEAVFKVEMPNAAPPPSVVRRLVYQMKKTMREQVRTKLSGAVKKALPQAYNAGAEGAQLRALLEGAAYRTGVGGEYANPAFVRVLEAAFYPDGLPEDGVMRIKPAELAFVELGVFWVACKGNEKYPSDSRQGAEGRKAYARFLAKARQGVKETCLRVKPAKSKRKASTGSGPRASAAL